MLEAKTIDGYRLYVRRSKSGTSWSIHTPTQIHMAKRLNRRPLCLLIGASLAGPNEDDLRLALRKARGTLL